MALLIHGSAARPRERGGPITPLRAELVRLLGIDQLGQSGDVGYIPDMGSLLAIQMGVGGTSARLENLRQLQIDYIGQYYDAQLLLVLNG